MIKNITITLALAAAALVPAQARSLSPDVVAMQDAFVDVAESTVNGVVSVKSYATPRGYGRQQGGGYDDFFNDPFFEYFFGQPQQRRQQPRQQQKAPEEAQQQLGLGSGVIISADGYIVTNNHVIEGAERLEVTLNDNRNFNARVIGADAATDLAVIKIEASDLHLIPMGNSDDLKVGQWVLAVGNPFGFTSSVTAGIVSAKARNVSTMTGTRGSDGIESYIQTDAAVNRGNSGGALVNLQGELVGINAAIYSQTGAYAGCSFAIPTSIVSKVVQDIREFGVVQRAMLGVTFQELTPETIRKKDIKGVTAGLLIATVQDRSAAKEAGLLAGDVIVAVNGNPVTSTALLQEEIAKHRPGDTVTVKVVRDGNDKTFRVTFRNSQGDTEVTLPGTIMDLGCAFMAPDDDTMSQLEISGGAQVSGLRTGKMKDAGITEGFIITEVNGTAIRSPKDMEAVYDAIIKSTDDHVMFVTGIYPTGQKMYYAVPLGQDKKKKK